MSEREPAHTIACMDSWAKAQGLATFSEMSGTLRDLLDMWHGGHLQVRPEAEGAWLAAVQVGESALARSGQAASGSSQGARSDEQRGVGVGQPEAPTAAPLPKGWDVIRKDDLFKTIIVIAPNGYSAVTTAMSRNPENVLRMLVEDIAHPPARSGAAPKRDHCPEKLKSGGCQLHNLHCGYPKCNEAPVARSGAGSEEGQG